MDHLLNIYNNAIFDETPFSSPYLYITLMYM